MIKYLVLFVLGISALSHGGAFGAKLWGTSSPEQYEDHLKQKLSSDQYRVTRKNGTERPFKNDFWNNKADGIYVDIITGEPLFSSKDKFKSGTGWPSFSRTLVKSNIVEVVDSSLGVTRTEVRSKRGGNHLGHVFKDGPAPTGLRYCINSASLRFIPIPKLKTSDVENYIKKYEKQKLETAIFGAGCFWGVEEIFRKVTGVKDVISGYSGGISPNPTYSMVSSGKSGHAEVVKVSYDPKIVSYDDLLGYFWRLHDPTTLDRQGPDVGPQYRSVAFYNSEEQKKTALASKANFDKSKVFKKNAVTQILATAKFYPAEGYHQDYYEKNGGGSVCHQLRKR